MNKSISTGRMRRGFLLSTSYFLLFFCATIGHAQNSTITNSSASPGQVTDTPARAYAVTTSDSDQAIPATRGIYVGGAGNIKVDMVGGGTVTFTAVPVGTTLRVQAKRIYATGTTATLMVGLY